MMIGPSAALRFVTIAAIALATMVHGAPPSVAGPPDISQADIHLVGSKNYKKHYKHKYKHWNYRYPNNYWVGPAIGFGAGVLFGSILTAPRYSAPSYANRDAYCSRKYRSYNWRTKTYTGYDGKQHYCRIP